MNKKNFKMDCFGYSNGGCTVLNEALCVTRGRCSFYKTRGKAAADSERAQKLAEKAGFFGTYRPKEA
ncbi:MAG: hypothetical protein VB096_05875 [Pseudoflavonifractor sp.]|nr:hypothetical protein [Pseudoflavonifractor sp.]